MRNSLIVSRSINPNLPEPITFRAPSRRELERRENEWRDTFADAINLGLAARDAVIVANRKHRSIPRP